MHLERLAVVCADAHLEADLAGVRVVDHAAHLEAVDLAGDDAVLLDRRRPALGDQLANARWSSRAGTPSGNGLGDGNVHERCGPRGATPAPAG
jgi:hypothetical protein